MPITDIIEKIATAVKDQPDQTQLSLAVIKNGKTEYTGMIRENGNVNTIGNKAFAFETGSVTKAFTGYILAQMAVEKKISLDDPVQDFLSFPILNNPPITLRHLALHTSGLQKNPHDFEEQSNYDKNDPFRNYTESQLATYLLKTCVWTAHRVLNIYIPILGMVCSVTSFQGLKKNLLPKLWLKGSFGH